MPKSGGRRRRALNTDQKIEATYDVALAGINDTTAATQQVQEATTVTPFDTIDGVSAVDEPQVLEAVPG